MSDMWTMYNIAPDAVHYGILLKTLANKADTAPVFELLQRMRNSSKSSGTASPPDASTSSEAEAAIRPPAPLPEPTERHYTALLSVYSHKVDLPTVERLLHEMSTLNGFRPDIVAYNSVITGFGDRLPPSDLMRLYQQLLKMQMTPDIYTFVSLVRSCSRWLDVAAVEQLLADMHARNVAPSNRIYVSALSGFAKARAFGSLHKHYQEMRAHHISLDAYMIHAVCTPLSQISESLSLLRQFPSVEDPVAPAQEVAFAALLQSWAAAPPLPPVPPLTSLPQKHLKYAATSKP
jgi:pentatricopeptide repeat protein